MFTIRIAGLNIQIDNKYPYLESFCKDYVVVSEEIPDLSVAVTDVEIEQERRGADTRVSLGYAESICVYRRICEALPTRFNAFLFHSAVIDYKGRGYAFSAKSGTGKSTHISLWKRAFGDDVAIVNGDKPIVRYIGGRFVAYGTPWCGKEGWQRNSSAELCAICFLERGETNSIRKLDASDAVSLVFGQILVPKDLEGFDAISGLLDAMLSSVPCYLLRCNMDTEAAFVARDGMN